jgi:anti-sigma regulatory factor (Ser/Thr protein kinase)
VTSMFRFLPDPAELGRVRDNVRRIAADLGAAAASCDTAALVIDELVNNAIEHGVDYRTGDQELQVSLSMEAGRLVVEFLDPDMPESEIVALGRSLKDAADGLPPLDSERGRGLFLLAIYMEELRIDVATDGGLLLQGRLAG